MMSSFKFYLSIAIITLISPLSGKAQGAIHAQERYSLLKTRVTDLNRILDTQLGEDHFEISFSPLKLSFFKTPECEIQFDLSRRIIFYNHFDRLNFENDYLAFKSNDEAVFISTCSENDSYNLKFDFYTNAMNRLFESASKDLISMLYSESYKEGDISVNMKTFEKKAENHRLAEKESLAATERRIVRHFDVNDQNRKRLALERIEELNKLVKESSLDKSTYYKLKYDELLLVELDYKNSSYSRNIYLSGDMFANQRKVKSSRYSSMVEALLSFNRFGDVFVLNKHSVEHYSRCIELLQILFGEKKSRSVRGSIGKNLLRILDLNFWASH